MSASSQAWPRAAAAAVFLAAACGGGGGGGGSDIPSPVVTSIDPSSGFSGHETDVVITGDNFLISPDSSTILVWLDATPLLNVTRDAADPVHKLHATVPAGLSAGAKTLKVQNAFGRSGSKAGAYTVTTSQGGVLVVTGVQVAPSEVNVAQTVTVQAVVKNAGSAEVTSVVATLPHSISTPTGGSAAVTTGPTPSSRASLAPGDSVTFSWTVEAITAGKLGTDGKPVPLPLTVTASGQDTFSGEAVQSVPVSGSVAIALPAGLTATVVAGRDTADPNQDVPVTFTVSNGGTASANLTSLVQFKSLQVLAGSGSASCKNVSPNPTVGSPVTVGAQASRAFTWTCSATAAGTLTVSGTATGKDANTGADLSATPATSDTVTILTEAVLQPVVTIGGGLTTVTQGQEITVNLDVGNGGTSPAHVNTVTPRFTPVNPNPCYGLTPTPPVELPGSGSVRFTWKCAPFSTPTLALWAEVEGSDDNDAATLSATAATVNLAVQPPTTLVASVSATPSGTPTPPAADTGQTINVSLQVTNGNGTGPQLDSPSVAAVIDASSTATGGSCGTPSALPAFIVSGGKATSTWTCTATGAGELRLTGTVNGTDHNSGLPVPAFTPTSVPVTVQVPAGVEQQTFAVSPTTVDTAPDFTTLTLTLLNNNTTAGAPAQVTIVPSATPSAGVTCGPTPAPSETVAGGATLQVSWTCSSTNFGTHTYSATVTAVDVNDPVGNTKSVSVTPASTVVVQRPAALTATWLARPTQVSPGTPAAFTVHVQNTGDAVANVSSVEFTTAAGLSCGSVSPDPASTTVTIAGGGGTQDFGFSCSAASAGSYTMTPKVVAADARGQAADGSPGQTTLAVPGAALTASLSAPASATVGQTVTVTLSVVNSGTGNANVSIVSPVSPNGFTNTTCTSWPAPFSAAPGTTNVSWSCFPRTTPSIGLNATVSATDVASGVSVTPTVTGTTLPVSEVLLTAATPAVTSGAFTAGTPSSTPVTVSMVVTNSGTAPASVVVTPTPIVGSSPISCNAVDQGTVTINPAVSTTATFTWSCDYDGTSGASGEGFTLGATVSATDTISTGNVSPASVPTTTVTLQ